MFKASCKTHNNESVALLQVDTVRDIYSSVDHPSPHLIHDPSEIPSGRAAEVVLTPPLRPLNLVLLSGLCYVRLPPG